MESEVSEDPYKLRIIRTIPVGAGVILVFSIFHTDFELEYGLQLLQAELIDGSHGVVDNGAADEEYEDKQVHVVLD